MTTALHLLTAQRIREADDALKAKIAGCRVIVCDASLIRQPEFDTLRALAPQAKLLASINAHALYAQGVDNEWYNEFRRMIRKADVGGSGVLWYGDDGNTILGPDADTDASLGPELYPSLRTAEALADACNALGRNADPIRKWDGWYNDDSWLNGYPGRYRRFSTMYGLHAVNGWRGYIGHYIRCMASFGWKVWVNSASAAGHPGQAGNCCEVKSNVPWGTLAREAAKAGQEFVAWNYPQDDVPGLVAKGEVLDG